MYGLWSLPVCCTLAMIDFASFIGIENPTFSASAATAVLTPITSPLKLSNGPPELPELIAASV